MDYVLIPRMANHTSVELRVAVFGTSGEDPGTHYTVLTDGKTVHQIHGWTRVPIESPIWWASVTLEPSRPRQEYRLLVGDTLKGLTCVSALPSKLGAEPFRVLLASCFDPGLWSSRGLENTLSSLGATGPLPHVKLLCGDQVYMDPVLPVSLKWRGITPDARAAAIYRHVWTHPGFRALVADGMNVMCPDDHDYWDNYTVEMGRQAPDRERIARELVRAFQCSETLQAFTVGTVRFLVVDTRQQRTDLSHPEARFIDEGHLDSVVRWIEAEDGPGVLVLGQPLFGEDGYKLGRFGSDLPQYDRQFRRIAAALLQAPCSMVVLSGDVHWGRIAHGKNTRGKALIEVISSPLGLTPLRSFAGMFRRWRKAKPMFPGLEGLEGCPIESPIEFKVTAPHFATLDFRAPRDPSYSADLEVRGWPLHSGRQDQKRPVFSCRL